MQPTSISWCDYTWNPLRGCSRISEGCRNCYAGKIAARFSDVVGFTQIGGNGGVSEIEKYGPFHGFAEFRIVGGRREAHWTGKVEVLEDKLLEPLSWRKKAQRFADKHGRRPRCFSNSMSDLFHDNLRGEDIDKVFAVMTLCPEIDFLVLTKRASRMEQFFADIWGKNADVDPTQRGWDCAEWLTEVGQFDQLRIMADRFGQPLPWIWLGVSVEDQKRADERIPHLLRTPAAVRFLSCEPLLDELDILPYLRPHCSQCGQRIDNSACGPTHAALWAMRGKTGNWINWVITGAESGPGARPCQEDWIRSLRDQSQAAGTPFFYKQMVTNGKKVETPELDGQRWAEMPCGPTHSRD